MAALNPNSNMQILPDEEKLQIIPLKSTHSSIGDDQIIDAVPISFCLPEHDAAINNPVEKIGRPSGQTASFPRKVKRPKIPPEWLQNWRINIRTRKNGRVDKYYYHKDDFICRSLKEVERYEKEGIRPQRKAKTQGKDKEKNSTEREIHEMSADEGKKELPIEVMLANKKGKELQTEEMLVNENNKELQTEEMLVKEILKEEDTKKTYVEQFLAEAHYSILHMFDGKQGGIERR